MKNEPSQNTLLEKLIRAVAFICLVIGALFLCASRIPDHNRIGAVFAGIAMVLFAVLLARGLVSKGRGRKDRE